MPWKPITEADDAIARDIKTIAQALLAARRVLDPHDPVQGPVWRMVDAAEAHLSGLAIVIGHGEEEDRA